MNFSYSKVDMSFELILLAQILTSLAPKTSAVSKTKSISSSSLYLKYDP